MAKTLAWQMGKDGVHGGLINKNVMIWPPTCGVPSTDLICLFPHYSLQLLHPSFPYTHITFIYCAIILFSYMGWVLELDGQVLPPTHIPFCVFWKTFLSFFSNKHIILTTKKNYLFLV